MTVQLSLFDPVAAPNPATTPQHQTQTLADAVDAFLHAQTAAGKSHYTIKAYRSDLKAATAFIGGQTPLPAINDQILNVWLNDRARHCKPKTLERAVTSTRSLFAWLTETHALARNPAAAIKYRPLPVSLPKLPTRLELQRILDAAALTDPRPNALVNLILHTGLKKGELMRLELGDIAHQSVLVKYTNSKLLWKARRLPLPDHLTPILWQYREAYPETDRENLWFPFAEKTVELAIAHAGRAANLPGGLTAETLRWTYAVYQAKAGTPPDTLRENLGLSMVAWYNTWKKIRALARLYDM